MSRTLKNALFVVASTLVGVGLMACIYRGFDFGQLRTFFSEASNYPWIALTLLAGVAANVLRALRWRMLLRAARIDVSVRTAVELVFISYLINSVTPRLGELTRSLLVRKGNARDTTRALGTVVVEKVADVGCLVLVIGLAVALRWQKTVALVHSLTDGLTLALPSYTLFLIVGCTVCLLVGVSLPLWRHVQQFVRNLWQGISAISRLRSPLSFATLCLGIWTCNFLQLYLLVPCFASLCGITAADMLHVFAAASVGVLLPTPAGAGPWHFAIVKTMTGVYGVAKGAAKSFALITHGTKTILVMLLGALGYATYYRAVWKRWHG